MGGGEASELEPLLATNPEVLDAEVLELALEEMRRLFPDKDPVSMLRTNRGFLNSVQNLGSLSRADHLMGGVGRGGVDYW